MINKGKINFQAVISIDEFGDIATDIVDKGNGNITVCSDVEPDYLTILKEAHKMYDYLEILSEDKILSSGAQKQLDKLLAKARGES